MAADRAPSAPRSRASHLEPAPAIEAFPQDEPLALDLRLRALTFANRAHGSPRFLERRMILGSSGSMPEPTAIVASADAPNGLLAKAFLERAREGVDLARDFTVLPQGGVNLGPFLRRSRSCGRCDGGPGPFAQRRDDDGIRFELRRDVDR